MVTFDLSYILKGYSLFTSISQNIFGLLNIIHDRINDPLFYLTVRTELHNNGSADFERGWDENSSYKIDMQTLSYKVNIGLKCKGT